MVLKKKEETLFEKQCSRLQMQAFTGYAGITLLEQRAMMIFQD